MKLLRKPIVNAAVMGLISVLYAGLFFLLAGHAEFLRLLNHPASLSGSLWNGWTVFLRRGGLRLFGVLYLLLAAAVAGLILARRGTWDEYQGRCLERGLLAAGALTALLLPLTLLLVLSDPNYAPETVTLLTALHWLTALLADLFFVARQAKD